MPQINFISVATFLQSAGLPPANYLPISAIPADNGDAPFAEVAKLYSSTTAMLDDGWLSTDDAVLSAAQVFGQGAFTPTIPTRICVVKRAVPVAQVSEFTVNVSVDGDYKLFIAYIGGSPVEAATFTASLNTVTDIKDGLLASLAGGPFAGVVTGASVDLDTGSVTADVAGAPFVLTGTGPGGATDITIDTTTPNVGIYEDLDAAWNLVKFWGVIPDPAEAEGTMIEVSRWTEASAAVDSMRRNVCFLQTTDADILTQTLPNFADTLSGLGRTRTFADYYVNQADKMTAAWFGRYGAQFPGSRAWHYGNHGGSSLTTTINYTKAQGDALKASRCSWVERFGQSVNDELKTLWGQGSGGFFVAQKQAEDYWWLRTNAAVSAAMSSLAGVNLDDAGIAKLVDAIRTVNNELGTNDPPVIDLARTTVTPVDLSTVPDAEKAIGDYKTSGGIQVDTVLIPKLREVAVSGIFATA